jgi:hypothetical protein
MIEHFPQAIEVATGQRLWHKLTLDGNESALKAATTALISTWDFNGNALLSGETMTQYSTTAWYYYDVDASGYTKGMYYRAVVTWTDETYELAHTESFRFDVVREAWNNPLITSEEIDNLYPAWQGVRPGSWADWSEPIKAAHRDLMWALRSIEQNGDLLRPYLILDRGKLYACELALTLYNITMACSKLEALREERGSQAQAALIAATAGPYLYDKDDDTVVDAGEEEVVFSGPMFTR